MSPYFYVFFVGETFHAAWRLGMLSIGISLAECMFVFEDGIRCSSSGCQLSFGIEHGPCGEEHARPALCF